MNGQMIPGFYFDPEKKKYFRIQSGPGARQLDVRYAAEKLRHTERQQQLHEAARAKSDRIRKERVTRLNRDHVEHLCLDREFGTKHGSYYQRHGWPEACFLGVNTKPECIVQKPKDGSIRFFEKDPASRTLYAVHGENKVKRRRFQGADDSLAAPKLPSDIDNQAILRDHALNGYALEEWDELARATSTISSLTFLPATGALAVTSFGSDRPPTVYLTDPERDGPYMGELFTPKGCATIWGATARPNPFSSSGNLESRVAAENTECLAVAAASSLLTFLRSQSGSWGCVTSVQALGSDILAPAWISSNTIALGCRDGQIHIHDSRSAGTSHILTHPHPVASISRADDDTRMLVSGLGDSLFLYDIRSPRMNQASGRQSGFSYINTRHNDNYVASVIPGGQKRKKRMKIHNTDWRHWSQPILVIQHSNTVDFDAGMDVHRGLGLVAASQDVTSSISAIKVSSLWTGQTVKEFEAPKTENMQKIQCLKFIDDNNCGSVELWASWNGAIMKFDW